MKLLTKKLCKAFPALYSTENTPEGEKPVIAKFFTPYSDWTWYAVEASAIKDGEYLTLADCPPEEADEVLFFGLVEGFAKEWGYFSLADLKSINAERDLYYEGTL